MLSTKKDVLQQLHHPIAKILLEWRKLSSMLVKAVFAMKQMEHPIGGGQFRIFVSCNTFTSTGRIAIRDPNLQNLPKSFMVEMKSRDIVNVALRNSIKAGPGMVLLSIDYCQLEMRILAHLSNDPFLLQVLNGRHDVFKLLASQWLGKEVFSANGEVDQQATIDNISEKERQATKAICYGIVYGMGPVKLAQDR